MTFFRFEGMERGRMTPNLSTAQGPIIEGEYMYFCNVFKDTGTGYERQYLLAGHHPAPRGKKMAAVA